MGASGANPADSRITCCVVGECLHRDAEYDLEGLSPREPGAQERFEFLRRDPSALADDRSGEVARTESAWGLDGVATSGPLASRAPEAVAEA
jgi:hypothetical protein